MSYSAALCFIAYLAAQAVAGVACCVRYWAAAAGAVMFVAELVRPPPRACCRRSPSLLPFVFVLRRRGSGLFLLPWERRCGSVQGRPLVRTHPPSVQGRPLVRAHPSSSSHLSLPQVLAASLLLFQARVQADKERRAVEWLAAAAVRGAVISVLYIQVSAAYSS